MKTRGFSLMEILVALVIVGVLAGISIPSYKYLVRQAVAKGCISNLNGLGIGLNSYLVDHNMMMPKAEVARRSATEDVLTIDRFLADYVSHQELFRCPADREGIYEETGTSYFWNSLLSGQSALNLKFLFTDDEIGIPVLSDKEGFHKGIGDGVNVLYADGHVSRRVRFFNQ